MTRPITHRRAEILIAKALEEQEAKARRAKPNGGRRHRRALKGRLYTLTRGRCEGCQARKRLGHLHLHHTHYHTFDEERLRDVQLLCRRCHTKLHAWARARSWVGLEVPIVRVKPKVVRKAPPRLAEADVQAITVAVTQHVASAMRARRVRPRGPYRRRPMA